MKIKTVLSTIIITLLLLLGAGCSSSSSDDDDSEPSTTEETGGGTEFTGPPSNNPPCESLAFGDGRGGDLWIPRSESDGLPVYLLNNGWQDPATVDAVLFSGGTERGRFTGFANPDAGIRRPHYRFSRGCQNYTGTLIVTDSSQVCEIQLPGSPCSRID